MEQKLADMIEKTGTIKLLLIEDDAGNRELVKMYLKKLNIALAFAENGEAGLELLKKNQYDLVILDMQMPVLDGYQLIDDYRRFEKSKESHTPVIALTAETDMQAIELMTKKGCDTHLGKPVTKLQLLSSIYSLLYSERTSDLRPGE